MEKLQHHHKAWPKRDYRSRVEKKYRNLPCNIRLLAPVVHAAIHRLFDETPGGKPSREYMVNAIVRHERGECACKSPSTSAQKQSA